MNEVKLDTNALLLQVMAHDLLAPLTAIRWELELLQREGSTKTQKGTKYTAQLQESANLGIILSKHAHVAGKVLVGSYTPDPSTQVLTELFRDSIEALRLQYERHGVGLELDIEQDESLYVLDKELVGLFMWSLVKYFLVFLPQHETVSVRGIPSEKEAHTYTVVSMAENVPDATLYAELLQQKAEARNAYDQAYVFAALLQNVSRLIDVDISASAQDNGIAIEAVFKNLQEPDA